MNDLLNQLAEYSRRSRVSDVAAGALTVVIVIAVVAVVRWQFAAAQKNKAKIDSDGRLTWRRGPLMAWSAGAMIYVLPPVSFGASIARHGVTAEGLLVVGFFSFLSILLGIWLLVEGTRFRVAAEPAGLECQPGWGEQRFIPWNEIRDVYTESMHSSLTLQTTDDWLFRVPLLMPGMPEFLHQLETHLPRPMFEKLRPHVKGLLEKRTAAPPKRPEK